MKMRPTKPSSLRGALEAAGRQGVLSSEGESRSWRDVLAGTILSGRRDELRGKSVLIATSAPFHAASALVELDGLASRVVLYPPDLRLDHLSFVMESAGVEAIVSDRILDRISDKDDQAICITPSSWQKAAEDTAADFNTEWVLLTSGTTGRPKLVLHTLASLTDAIVPGKSPSAVIWSTFYDIRRYGGLQIFLRAIFTGSSLVLSSAGESTGNFLARAASHGITHISGTPSHWRRALMSSAAKLIAPQYVRLSGEIADRAILNQLRLVYPGARIAHAFATTEAGLAFEVNDGMAGFPANILHDTPHVEMRVESRSLRIRSDRTASRYLGEHHKSLRDTDGFVDTGDILKLREGRYHFVGRFDGTINVGGMKVHPEEVEAIINGHPKVEMSLVTTRKNPITGALVIANVVLKHGESSDASEVRMDILRLCREALPAHKVPATVSFVTALAVADSGKLIRLQA